MKYIFLIAICVAALSANGQSADSLIGDWKFKDIYKGSSMDSSKRDNLKFIFGELRIELKQGNTYSAYFSEAEEGSWQYDPDLRQIIFRSEKGESIAQLIEVTTSSLVLELKKGVKLILERVLIK